MEPKKQKKKKSYTLMVIADSAEGRIRQFKLSWKIITAVISIVVLLTGAMTVYVVYTSSIVGSALEANDALATQVAELTTEKETLIVHNAELEENVTLLSDTINEKVQKEEEDAEKSIPSGFPLAGAAMIQESSEIEPEAAQDADEPEEVEGDEAGDEEAQEEAAEEKTPIVVFAASTGTSVIVTGNGTVEAVEADEEYGGLIRVNHGNGYISIYRNPSPAKVKVGDEITKGTMLIEMTTDDEKLGYQIMRDGEYIDPLELMEIYG